MCRGDSASCPFASRVCIRRLDHLRDEACSPRRLPESRSDLGQRRNQLVCRGDVRERLREAGIAVTAGTDAAVRADDPLRTLAIGEKVLEAELALGRPGLVARPVDEVTVAAVVWRLQD